MKKRKKDVSWSYGTSAVLLFVYEIDEQGKPTGPAHYLDPEAAAAGAAAVAAQGKH